MHDDFWLEEKQQGNFSAFGDIMRGDPGPHFTPSVDENGNISWTNNGNLPNPQTQNIKGPSGKSAYQQAVEGGYRGTEAEFNAILASFPENAAQIGQNTSDISDLNSALNRMENGVNENMTAGNAMQLDSSVYAEDQVPYLFRQTGGGVNAGTREIDTIVGGTVVWNQIIKNPNCSGSSYISASNGTVSVSDNVASFTASAKNGTLRFEAGPRIAGHRLLMIATIQLTTATGSVRFYSIGAEVSKTFSQTTNVQTLGQIVTVPSNIATWNCDIIDGRENGWDAIKVFFVNIFDITQMFGSTIADYIYALDQAHAGDGIAFFRSLFSASYYPYDTGTLKSVEGLQSHEMTGFNQWDEEWELGTYNGNTGEKISVNNCIRSKNAINCFPDAYYYLPYLNGGIYLFFYDSNGNYIGTVARGGGIIQIPNGVHQIRFRLDAAYGTTYNHDICINISDPAKNGAYEPYQKHSYPLDSDLTLRGIPKLDANNKLYYDGDTYAADGSVTRRYGVVDLGTLNWTYYSTAVRFSGTYLPAASSGRTYLNWVCGKYETSDLPYIDGNRQDKLICVENTYVFVRDSAYTDAATFKAAMSGVYLVYELATPTTETAEPVQTPQICDKAGTEEYVTTGIVPVGHLTKYPEDLRAKIEGLPWNLSMIAPIENGTTASQAYTTGQYFLHNDLFCKALTSIASGATFTLNTNYAVTTLAAELFAALNS